MDRRDALCDHLQGITGLTRPVVEKILEETLAWHTKDLAAWVRDRHRELQRQGLRNREIYPRLREEARRILVRPGTLSERQIRRLIYG